MNGPHDLGGAHGFGPVKPEPNEPWFHSEWESRAFALTLAMGATGVWNLDMSRHARERIAPADYLSSTYYDLWRKGLERLVVEHRLVTAGELEAGRSAGPPAVPPRTVKAADVPAMLTKGSSYEREPAAPPRYAVGENVRARVMNPPGHTRLPRYLRGRKGRIAGIRGVHVFPDSNAAGKGEEPQWLYSVAFEASEVWGPDTRQGDVIHADLFEPYLERA